MIRLLFYPVKTNIFEKLERLQKTLRTMKRVAIAFSGGVDSAFLVKIAYDVLGANVLAITAVSPTYPKRELRQAEHLAQTIGVPHIIISSEEMKNERFSRNLPNRCYYCKKELFSKIQKIASEKKLDYILDGSTADDTFDYRPGAKALKEMDVRSPLKEVGLTKQEIRELSRSMRLESWDKPASACLASRFPYGVEITRARLKQVEQAEDFLHSLGIRQVRVRYHHELARIEIAKDEFQKIIRYSNDIVKNFKKLGFAYIALDIEGYRTGSLNEVLKA